MKYLSPSPFSSRAATQEYRDNWEQTFGPRAEDMATAEDPVAPQKVDEDDRERDRDDP